MIQTIIFDVDDTLYSYTKSNKIAFDALHKFAEKEFGWDAQKFDSLHDTMMHSLIDYMGRTGACHNRFIRFQNILEAENLPIKYALTLGSLYWNTLIQASEPYENEVETFAELKKRGLRIGIGTNMTTRVQLLKLEHLGLLDYVDFFVSSEETSSDKPFKPFFDKCIEKARCPASSCIFAGDNYKYDVLGSREQGINPIWIQVEREKSYPKAEFDVPIIKNWSELLPLLENLYKI